MLKYLSACSFCLIIFIFVSSSCKEEIVREQYMPRHNHVAYLSSLDKIGLLHTALGADWKKASEMALTKPMYIETPFAEDFFSDPSEATAVGYRFSAKRGHKIDIDLDIKVVGSVQIFLDVFRVDNDSLGEYKHIASSGEHDHYLEFEPRRDSEYILRFQTELLRGGNFSIRINAVPALVFPVVGKGNGDIGSLFGAPRDGGRRKHHGVDIFAKRHTPIIAPAEGRIRFAGNRGLGGTVIWMRDTERDQTLYFAHLQDVMVERGDSVYPGDTIGTVGNSGNARTTPPHLHFGMYKNGPIDPYHFIARTTARLSRRLADKSMVGHDIRTKQNARLRLSGITKGQKSVEIAKFQIMETLGASGSYFRVRLPDNTAGYINHSVVEVADEPIKQRFADYSGDLLSLPMNSAFHIDKINEGEKLKVYGRNADYGFIEKPSGQKGWLKLL